MGFGKPRKKSNVIKQVGDYVIDHDNQKGRYYVHRIHGTKAYIFRSFEVADNMLAQLTQHVA